MKRTLTNYLGLLGVVSLLSYTAAVTFSPLAYPDYHWLSQSVSDLSAETAPSGTLWNQLSALYMPCGIVCCTVSCIAVAGKYNKILRLGIYLFALMNWVAAVGYAMFPLTDAGTPDGFQNIMHLVVTGAVVVLSILALALIMSGGYFQRQCQSLGFWAGAALFLMILGALSVNLFPSAYFGLTERFSTFAAVGFNAVLGIYLYNGFPEKTTRRVHDGKSN
jgi:hypothetical membrane protein